MTRNLATALALAAVATTLPVRAAADPPLPAIVDLSLEELATLDVSASSLLHAGLLDAGSSIGAVGPADWRRQGARRMLDALEFQSGIMVLPSTSGNQVLAVRGYARSTSYTGTATNWDDVPLNDLFRSGPQFNTPTINLGALSQIQLIQGPGSSLYGSDAFHGLVALRGFESDADMSDAQASIGSRRYYEAALQRSSALGESARLNLALAVNGQGDQDLRASYVEPATGTTVHNDRDNRYGAQTLSLKLASGAGRALSWYGGLYLHHYEADEFQGFGTRLSGRNDVGWVDTRFAMAQAGVRQALDKVRSVELKAYYWHVDSDLAANLQLATGPVRRDLYTLQHRGGVKAIYRDAWRPANTEWALAIESEWLGVDSAKAEARSGAGQLLSVTVNPAEGAQRTIRSATLEANTTWDKQRWRLVYGGRIDHYSDFGRHASPRLGLIWHPRADSAIKLLYGQAFRAPSAVEIGGAQNSILGNPNLKPETIDSYELVAMRETRTYRAQLTAYRTFWRNGIATVIAPGARLGQYQNVERNDAKGLNASVEYRAAGWLFDTSASWTHSRNTRTGKRYAMFPRAMLNVAIGHALFDTGWQALLGQRWQLDREDMASSEGFVARPLANYARTDLTVSKEFSSRLKASMQLRNLFDRSNILPSPQASLGGIPDEPFNLQLSLARQF
jgi:outer membrane cobalamin receptor